MQTAADSPADERGPSPGEAAEKAAAVRRMFGAVAPRYDLLNHLLSLNIDRRWRRKAVDRLLALSSPDAAAKPVHPPPRLRVDHLPAMARPEGVFLDSCAGTLDLAVELATRSSFQGRVVACDFTLPMLEHGVSKVRNLPIALACADALRLPLADGSMDGAMVAFGVRNLASIDAGLTEFARVLKPGAPLVILEFTTPGSQPFRGLYLFYFRHLLPLIGRALSRHRSAYTYLPASVDAFPSPAPLAQQIRAAGFDPVRWETLTGGVAAIHSGTRKGIT
ncbi:MAG: ubiquinone/menaquinone biosynthesis methyltransferase [Longimicrobiales bacterium]